MTSYECGLQMGNLELMSSAMLLCRKMAKRTAFFAAPSLVFWAVMTSAGCFSTKSWLWQPLPQQIVVAEDLVHRSDIYGDRVTLPRGRYRFWKNSDRGPVFRTDAGTINLTTKGPFGSSITGPGGLLLSMQRDEALPVAIIDGNPSPWDSGELNIQALARGLKDSGQIKKFGFAVERLGTGLNADERKRIGLPRSCE